MSNGNQNTKENRKSLAPCVLEKENPAYKSVEELNYAMLLPECRNIALTGVFGSGKSSVIDSYLSKTTNVKSLRISLSNFEDKKHTNPDSGKKGIDVYENEIEGKLFQHIIYKAKSENTQRSRFKRLRVLDIDYVKKFLGSIFTFFMCFVIVFEPKFLQIDSFYVVYFRIFGSWAYNINLFSDIIASVTMLLLLYWWILEAYKRYSGISIERITAKDFGINLKKEKSVLNKLLDEILYYFKAGEYDVIVFEDLDRILNPGKLFLKLREINILLNESDYCKSKKKTVRFVYAIKDDIFQNEVRTKCFDYIIPIIPVVNCFNAGEYLLKNYKEDLQGIDDSDVKRLGAYVFRMRDLVNIMNEFMLYKKTILKDSMSATKLLAITIYKNLYPHDYSKIHTKDGFLYRAFNNKRMFFDPQTKEKKEVVVKCEENIMSERESISKIRLSILNWLNTNHDVTHLVIKGKSYLLKDVALSDALYDYFKKDKVEGCVEVDGDYSVSRSYSFKYRDILKSVDEDNTIEETICEHESTIKTSLQKKNKIENQIYNIENKTLCDLMCEIEDGNMSKSILIEATKPNECKENEEKSTEIVSIDILHALIRAGYISDDYSSYVSYTYTGSFDDQDFRFQQSVIQNIPLEYGYRLNHIGAFIDTIYTDNYKNRSILNFDLLDYLIQDASFARLDNFIQTARRHLDFVVQYDHLPNKKMLFFEELFKQWQGCVSCIADEKDNEVRTHMLHLLYRYASNDLPMSKEEKEFVESQYSFIAEDFANYDFHKLGQFISCNHLVFNTLILPNETTKPLFDNVVSHNQYAVNYENLKLIYGPDFDIKSFSVILKGEKTIKQYVTKDIVQLLSLFPNSNVEEDESAMLAMTKYGEITDEQLVAYCGMQKRKFSNLSEISAERNAILVKSDLVYPTWSNVRVAYKNISDSKIVTDYVDIHAVDLSQTKMQDGDNELQCALLDNNHSLSLDAYRLVASSALYYVDFKNIDGLNEERLSILLDNGLIAYKSDNTTFISKYSYSIIAKYLIMYMDDIMQDKNDVEFTNSNALGCEILKSNLTIEQKMFFMDTYAVLDNDTDDKYEYARLICEFYHDVELDDDTDYNLIVNALEIYSYNDCWHTKIELINKVHKSSPYDSSCTERMVNSLGYPYTEFTIYSNNSTPSLQNNVQNNELVDYLIQHTPYLCRKLQPENGEFRATYRKPKKS